MSIFSRRKKKVPPPPDLGTLFARLVSTEPSPAPRRLSRAALRAGKTEAESPAPYLREPSDFGLVEDSEASLLFLARLETEAPSLALICPPSDLERGREAILVLSLLAARGLERAEEGSLRPLLSRQPATKAAAEALLLRIGLASSYEFGSFRLLAEASALRSIELLLLREGLEPVLESARREASALDGAPSIEFLRLERPADIVASRLFMPARFSVGGFEAGVFWDSLRIEGEGRALPGGELPEELWFSASAGRQGSQVFFSCPAPREGRDAYAARILPILEAGWKGAAALLAGGRTGSGDSFPRLAPTEASSSEALIGGLRIEGELRLGGGGFRLSAHLPPAFLRLLRAASAATAEALDGASAIHDFLAANEALLARWRESYAAAYLAPRKSPVLERAPLLPTVASILGFLGPLEGGLLLQNCLLPGLGLKELPRLFYRRAEGKPGDKARLLPLEPFSESRILPLLPPLAREEWRNELARGFEESVWGGEEILAANEAAARLIQRAVAGGRIALSPASRALLEAELGKRIAARDAAELKALAAAGLPFGILDELGRPELIRLLGPFSNRELALGILGDEARLPLLKRAMSQSRLRQFAEELEAAAKRFARAELSAAELVEAKRELRAGLELRLKKLGEEKRAARGSAAGPRKRG